MTKNPTNTACPRSATILGRRDLLKSTAALLAVPSTALGRDATTETRDRFQVIFSDSNAVVEIASGKIRGYTEGGIHTFKGIPYGAPPTGNLRFMPPEKPKPWVDVRDSLQYGYACPQVGLMTNRRSSDLPQFSLG